WLIYPSLLVWYVPLAFVLAVFPIPAVAGPLSDQPAFREWFIATLPGLNLGPFWILAPSLAAAALGLWWLILGALLLWFTPAVQITFWPFADWFERRHARRVLYAGLLTVVAAAVFWGGMSRI